MTEIAEVVVRTADIRAFLAEAKRVSNSYLSEAAVAAGLLKESLEDLETIRAEILEDTEFSAGSLAEKEVLG